MKNELNKIFAASECPPGDLLRQYHDGKLFGIEKNSVEKHLASCEACSDELEGMFFNNDTINLEKTVAGLKENINVRLGIGRKKNSFTFYIKIAAVITILFVASVIIYISINSDQIINNNILSLNTNQQKTALESLPEKEIKAEEKKVDASGKSIQTKEHKAFDKESNLKSETQSLNKTNPTQESYVKGSSSNDVKVESGKDEYFGILAENLPAACLPARQGRQGKKGIEKIDKKENSQDGVVAGSSNSVTQTGSGKASVKTVVVDASEQKLSENQNNVSENTVVTTKISKETSKQDDINKNIIADNRNQKNESYKDKEEKKEQKKDETVSREKSKDELKNKKLADEEGKKSRAEETEKDLALSEESSDKLAKSNTNITTVSDTKKKGKVENPKKKKDEGSGESNMPSGIENGDYDRAMSKYKAGNYNEAANLFQQITVGNSSDYKALFYEAVCYYEQDKAQKAIVNFELVINLTSGEFADDARWYMALSYIKLNDKNTAQQKLQEIILKGGKHKTKAEKKIDEIK